MRSRCNTVLSCIDIRTSYIIVAHSLLNVSSHIRESLSRGIHWRCLKWYRIVQVEIKLTIWAVKFQSDSIRYKTVSIGFMISSVDFKLGKLNREPKDQLF